MAMVSSVALLVTVVAAQEVARVPPQPMLLNSTLQAWQQQVLDQHNVYRCMHGVPLMSWNSAIELNAQSWADHLAGNFNGQASHSSAASRSNIGGYSSVGENIAWGAQPAASVTNWYDEIAKTNGGWVTSFSYDAGHYTQVVWKNSVSLGCGWFTGSTPDYSTNYGNNLVCQYGPAGNFEGQFGENVNGPEKAQSSCEGVLPTPEPSPVPTPSPTPIPTPVPTPVPPPSGCVDIQPTSSCTYWLSQGWCDPSSQYYSYNKENCKQTCGLCDESVCVNKAADADCEYFYSQGWCEASSEYYLYNKEHCYKGCHFCAAAEMTVV